MKTVLSRYSIEDHLNSEPQVDGAPALYSGFDLGSGASVLVKFWPRRRGVDGDLLLLWRSELRQMQHLGGLPGVKEYLTPMHDAGVDDDGFYLILGVGDMRPLDWQQQRPRKQNTLSMKQTVRKLLWSNLRRIATGLGILHSQGLIHRNVTEASIFTEFENKPDYRLGGFEWNIRLNSFGSDVLPTITKTSVEASASFQQDWQAFAQLALRLLKVKSDGLAASPSNDCASVAKILSFSERHILRKLIHPARNDRPDTELVVNQIDKIISEHATSSSRNRFTLCFIYNHQKVGPKLAQLLTDDGFSHCDVTDVDAVIDFVGQDIFEAEFVELRQEKPHDHRFAVIGQSYVYFLSKHAQYDWHFAQVSSVASRIPSAAKIRSRKVLPQETVLVKTPIELARQLVELRGEADCWDTVFEQDRADTETNVPTKFAYDAYQWLFLIEGLQKAAEAWSVQVMDVNEASPGKYTYSFRLVEDVQRLKLSNALNLKEPFDRFIKRLENPDDQSDTNWSAVQQGPLTRVRGSVELTFEKFLDSQDDERFGFSGSIKLDVGERLLLRPNESSGDSKSMQRRNKMLARLAEHDELLSVLSSPLVSARKSHDCRPSLDPNLLDESKQRALLEIIDVLPMYFLQGPPGTGKTHLVSQLVKHIVATTRSPRLLISAQGHDPINNLMAKITEEFEHYEVDHAPMMVRSSGRRDKQIKGPTQLDQQAISLMQRVMESSLFQSAPEGLQSKICQLQTKLKKVEEGARFPDKALESLIFRSANIVFSTTNSGDLEELLDMSAHFDWSIVEEAGRATGLELLAPLMLSHRRLLIGDAQQLPSFGEDQIKRLLHDPAALRESLAEGRSLLDSTFSDMPVDDLLMKFAEPMFADRMACEVNRHLTLFASLHGELCSQRGMLPLAGKLNEQYRMRAEIADMVSKVFYKNELKTPESAPICNAKPPFQITNAKRLPSSPIVIVDTPYCRRDYASWAGDKEPAHHNPGEVEIVLKVLSLIRCPKNVDKPAKLAVLTPYNRQVIGLKRAIASKVKTDLVHLRKFDASVEMVQTIDSFQGKEADVVVVSLVRNNARSWKSALGILADFRRMNVLLSRAKFKLVIVGSLEFLNLRFIPGKKLDESDELYFLYDWLKYIKDYGSGPNEQSSITIIPPSHLDG